LHLKEFDTILSFMTAAPTTAERPKPALVLTKAALRAADILGLNRAELARILGISAASASRLGRTRSVDPASKEGELALLFLRAYRSLDSMFSGNRAASQAWLRAENDHLGGCPIELIERVEGLVRVASYLDAMRAKS
jgi:Antitoxin Xre/MbcA/ParS C-terminal toxin-binding domain/Antitoxin Xre-like helix-turn-helix domain